MRKAKLAASAAIALFGLASLGAETEAQSLLPQSESFRYERTMSGKTDEVQASSRLVETKAGSWYEISTHSEEQDSLLRLDPKSLFATYSEVTTRGKDGTLKRITSVLENKILASPDEIYILGGESLPYSLRAFPWGTRQKVRLSFMGAGGTMGGSFHFDFTVTGKDSIQAGGRTIECWKAQLSISGIIGTFVGKSYLWYSTEYPHYLVRSEGASGPPGTPVSVMVLQSYSQSGRAN